MAAPRNPARRPLPPSDDLGWRLSAACLDREVDPAWFFGLDEESTARALEVCARCPVVEECAAEQRQIRAPGVWGGELVYVNGAAVGTQPREAVA